MISREQAYFLEILRLSMQGEKFELRIKDAEMLRRILQIASIQKVLPMICETIYLSKDTQKYSGIFSAYKKRAIDEVVSQTVRTTQFLDMYRYLECQGLKPVIVKGFIMRQLYPRENLRTSVDEDLLIPSQDRSAYHKVLQKYGMQLMEINQKAEEEPEISYINPLSGLYVEVHQYLFPPESEVYGDWNRFFGDSKPVVMTYKDQCLLTLNPTDHVFYLICHSFKHFLHSGFGIRQICDLALFSNAYSDEIDWNKVWIQCKEIHADGFVRAMFRISEKYLLPDNRFHRYLKLWNVDTVDEEPLLLDVLASGAHGAAELTRLHSSNITLNAVASQKDGEQKNTVVLGSIFLPVKKMKSRYRYLEKAPFLLPIAWIQRIAHYARELSQDKQVGTKGNNVVDSIKLGKQRVELLKQYGVIK